MTDISVYTLGTYQSDSRAWLAGPHGTEPGTTPQITLDLSTFTGLYPNGFIPSGVILAKITASGKYGPAEAGATDGRQLTTDLGLLFSSVKVPANTATPVGAAMLVHGFVYTAKLPLQSGTGGVTAGRKTALPLIYWS